MGQKLLTELTKITSCIKFLLTKDDACQ